MRQEVQRYEMGEVAHIENVLKGESKERVHRRASTREEVITVEKERIEERELDLQSTEQFEMQREAATIITEDSHLEAGVTVTASYGPTVSVTANLGYAANHSKEESSRVATNYSRDITERSASRIQERIREQRVMRIVTEIEETNKHGVNNTAGPDHVVGIYRWVDKIYKAQVFNYGSRLLLEFVVPEPAAFFLHTLEKGRKAEEVTMSEPEKPTISPVDLDFSTALELVKKYHVSGVTPPPEPVRTVSLVWEQPWEGDKRPDPGKDKGNLFYKASKAISITDGYRAVNFTAIVHASAWKSDVWLTVADVELRGSATGGEAGGEAMPIKWTMPLSDKDGELPVTLVVQNAWGFTVAIEVTCHRLFGTLYKWQLATYETIMRAYFELKAQYDEQVAAAATRRGVGIEGRNPLENRSIERNELKKATISMLMGQHFDRPYPKTFLRLNSK